MYVDIRSHFDSSHFATSQIAAQSKELKAMATDDLTELIGKRVKEDRVRSEQQTGGASTREVTVEKTQKFVDDLIEGAKVRSEQQSGNASTRQVMVEKTNEFVDNPVEEAKVRSEKQPGKRAPRRWWSRRRRRSLTM